jgi:2-keto-4-pentenoate hydratase/2-oxohepta-3-ene-1,7-dioic acid hydratase in catechol pathway
MKLVTFVVNGEQRFGVATDRGVLDVRAAAELLPEAGAGVPADVHEAIEGGADATGALGRLEEAVLADGAVAARVLIPEEGMIYGPCVTRPNKIICVGLNYRKHAEETNAPIPQYPILFNKFNNTLTGNGHDVPLPKVTTMVDYEAELVIVIGKEAKYIDKASALDYVFGYCNVNDLSARDLQLRTPQWLLGKTCDKFSPLGPYLVTADEVGDPNSLGIRCLVNGEVRQSSNTSDMIFRCDEIVSYISQHMTLVPGDIILTGTPEGVVLGLPEAERVYLKPNDVVTIEIEKLGSLTNRMAAE